MSLLQLAARRSLLRQGVLQSARRCASLSPWAEYEAAPPDPILGLSEDFARDDDPKKEIVGVGSYRDDHGKPYVLPVVRHAEQAIFEQNLNHEYLGIAGDPAYVDLALKFAYGDDSVPLQENHVAGVQSLSGTGGLRVMGELLHKHGHYHIYVPHPTWGNHAAIFTNSGLEVRTYPYYDLETADLDFDNLIKEMKEMPEESCVLLHACAHNPTGMDPSMEQWKQISELMKERNLLPFFDCAYQGFASGNAPEDAAAFRMFVEDGHNLALVQSFSKNFGLYGHRAGALSVVCNNEAEAKKVLSQMKLIIRPMYSNPPCHGARIVKTILSDPALTQEFIDQCKGMADRIHLMRHDLREKLEQHGSNWNWEHITKQIGMFAYSGLNIDEVTALREKHHVYCTADGRISMAGVTSGNVAHIADAIHDVTKDPRK